MSSQQECMNVIMPLQHKCMDVILSLPQEHIYEIMAIIPGTQIADILADILAMNTLAFHQLMTPTIKEIYFDRPSYWAEKAAKFVFHKYHKVNQPMIRNNRTWETQPMPVLEVVAYLQCNQFYNKRVVLKDVRKFLLSGNKLRKLT